MKVIVKVDTSKCNLCKLCVEYCPALVFTFTGKSIKVENEKCIGCCGCIPLCPMRAISVEILDSTLTNYTKQC